MIHRHRWVAKQVAWVEFQFIKGDGTQVTYQCDRCLKVKTETHNGFLDRDLFIPELTGGPGALLRRNSGALTTPRQGVPETEGDSTPFDAGCMACGLTLTEHNPWNLRSVRSDHFFHAAIPPTPPLPNQEEQ